MQPTACRSGALGPQQLPRLAAFRANAPEFQWRSTRLGCPDSGKAQAPAPRHRGRQLSRSSASCPWYVDSKEKNIQIVILSVQLLLLLKHWFHLGAILLPLLFFGTATNPNQPLFVPRIPPNSPPPPQHDLTSSGAPDNPPSPSSYSWMAATFAALGLVSSNT